MQMVLKSTETTLILVEGGAKQLGYEIVWLAILMVLLPSTCRGLRNMLRY